MINTALARQRRKEMGLSLDELGGLVGVDGSTLYRWENGEREPRNTSKLAEYARILDVSLDDLLGSDPTEATEVPT